MGCSESKETDDQGIGGMAPPRIVRNELEVQSLMGKLNLPEEEARLHAPIQRLNVLYEPLGQCCSGSEGLAKEEDRMHCPQGLLRAVEKKGFSPIQMQQIWLRYFGSNGYLHALQQKHFEGGGKCWHSQSCLEGFATTCRLCTCCASVRSFQEKRNVIVKAWSEDMVRFVSAFNEELEAYGIFMKPQSNQRLIFTGHGITHRFAHWFAIALMAEECANLDQEPTLLGHQYKKDTLLGRVNEADFVMHDPWRKGCLLP